jgi:hypothetical protein
MRTCKTNVVISGRQIEFCPGKAGRIWGKNEAGEKRRGLARVFSKKRPVIAIQKHEKPVFLMRFRCLFCAFLHVICGFCLQWKRGLPVSNHAGGNRRLLQPSAANAPRPTDPALAASLAKLWPNREHESNAVKNLFCCTGGASWI